MRKFVLLLTLLAVFNQALFGQPTDNASYFGQIANSIYLAEGGKKCKYPFGIRSVKVKDFEEARQVCITTISRRYAAWNAAGKPGQFIQFLGKKYAPTTGVTVRTANLNANWAKNVNFFMSKGLTNWGMVIAFENERDKRQ